MSDLLERLSAALAGRYRVERELGRGGMGVVLLAHDVKHDRKVAIKALLPDVAHGVSGERFLREIRIAARLQHPNILPLLDSGKADDLTYYVMPFVPGESLRQRLDRETSLAIPDALEIAREMADALAFAHEQNVVHRDIKPENILLSAGHALLSDFGVAHALATAGEKLTETGVAVGTPAYMSPEQGTRAGVDHRTDIYGLGCVLYEMLVGAPPFTGTFRVVMARKAVEPVPGIRVVRDTVPPAVEQAVMTALAKDPADRFATAREFGAALHGDAPAFARRHAARLSNRQRWMAAGALGAVLLLGGTYVLVAGVPFAERASVLDGARYTQLTTDHGVEWFPSLSPDGKWIVYAGDRSGNRDIYLQSVGAENAINLTPDSRADDDQPAISPDGDRIVFRSARDGGGIFVMGRTGDAVRRVASHGFHPTWSHDGARIAFATENMEMNPGNSESISELWIVDASGGSLRKLPSGDAVVPAWSPNGHRIAYTQRLGRPAQGDIFTIDPEGGDPVPLVQDPATDWSATWSADGRYVYFSSNRGGSMNLWRIAVDEKSGRAQGAPEALTTPATFLAHPAITRDGAHIAYTSAQVLQNIQRIAFDPVSATVVGDPQPVTTGSRRFSSPDPSPDGEWVAYYTLNQPEGDIYISRPDGTQRRQLTADSAIDRLPRWSPDGAWVAMFSNRGGPLQLWRVRADGSDLQRITTSYSGYLAWSPDGTRIATVTGENLRDTLAILDAFGAETQTPQMFGSGNPDRFLVNSWSPDGARLAGQVGAVGAMGRGVGVFDLRTGRYEKLSDFGEWPVWLPDSRRILFVTNGNSFHVVDSRTKQVRKVWSVDRDVIGPPRLTRDGRWAYFSRRATEADIWLLSLAHQGAPR